MPPQIASLVYVLLIIGLMVWDRKRIGRTSVAIWLPLIWISIGASRNVSEWFGMGISIEGSDQFVEGSPFDRMLTFGLLAAGLGILISRGQRTAETLSGNLHIVLFIAFCALSAVWSDFPFVTFKRWTKGLGNVVMIFVVLTDPDPVAAVKRLFARLGFVLIMVSLLFVKYYPDLGRMYDSFTGETIFTGVTTDKNILGSLCFVLALSSLWLLLESFREQVHKTQHVIVFGGLLAAAFWLLVKSDSATSLLCFVVGSVPILFLHASRARSSPASIHVMLGLTTIFALSGYAFFDAQRYFIEAMGRDATLTGRTELWETLIRMDVSPLVGAGFESFFLGDRLTFLWSKYWWHPNQAHNGYLEMYLSLGLIGAGLFVTLIFSGYRRIVATYRDDPRSASLRLAFWVTFVLYNLTEAAAKVMHPVWIVFLLAVTSVAHRSRAAVVEQVPLAFAAKRKVSPRLVQPRPTRPVGVRTLT